MLYKVTSPYAPEAEGGLKWDDPALGIDWRVAPSDVVTNARDAAWPPLAELGEVFPAAA